MCKSLDSHSNIEEFERQKGIIELFLICPKM
jgi:hypothetical protein